MRINPHHLALITAAACAIAPASAAAQSASSTLHHNAKAPCVRDYSRNSVSGGYCPGDDGAVASAVAPITPSPSPTIIVKHVDGGFSWSDAGAGAGLATALMAVAAGGAIAFRRRRPSLDARRSVATH